ncbi:MAG: DMT family transporter [Bryobacterales bacterium]|nr:DMT family transporter [Bryobacteraceae bacterium]MDW8355656.1 DMT family transporter [Bryobacterales bacterium]
MSHPTVVPAPTREATRCSGGSRRAATARLYALILLMVLFWTANFLIGKVALREFPILLLAGMRTALAAVLLLPVYVWSRRAAARAVRIEGPDRRRLLLLGVFGVTLNQLFFVGGLALTSAAHASVLMSLTPILVLVLAAAAGQERVTVKKAAGMSVALLGAAWLSGSSSESSGATVTGDVLVLLAALAFAGFTVGGKQPSARYGSVTVNTFAYGSGALMLAPLTAWQAFRFDFATVSAAAWASFAYMALFPSLVCYLIFSYALARLPASRLTAFGYLQPLLATTGAAVFLGEPVTLGLVAAGALVLAGVYLAERA